jgi:UPF0042 nucleotide-binding protein
MSTRFVILSGLSGAGKSTAAKCFEDVGYYCVDNLPTPLLERFLDEHLEMAPEREQIAVVADVRAPGFAEDFPRLLDTRTDDQKVTLIFFEASDEILVRRFSETRRPHPLAKDRPVLEGIRMERELLAELRSRADLVIDTGEWSVHDLRRQIFRDFVPDKEAHKGLVVSVSSFGFKHGIPRGTDLLFDVRFLPNPHFVPGLREQTGLDPAVEEFLGAQEEFGELQERLGELLLYLLPKFQRETRSYLSVAIGCTGGKHRSVAMAEALGKALESAGKERGANGWSVQVSHRDIERGG